MSENESWLAVARECPRRIMEELHRAGEYRHGTTPRFPGKVLCCHRSTALPEGWQPTVVQTAASLAQAHRRADAPHAGPIPVQTGLAGAAG